MENSLTKQIDESTDENLILVRQLVDKAIFEYSSLYFVTYVEDERNDLIMKIFSLLEKKYLASPNSRWERHKNEITSIIISSFISKKNLDTID